jgi:hypothetical protein
MCFVFSLSYSSPILNRLPTSDITAYVRHASTRQPLVRCGKNWNQILTVVTLVARNANEAMGVQWWGMAKFASSRISESGDRLVRIWRQLQSSFFSSLSYLIRTFTNVVLSMRFAKIMLQQIAILFNTKSSIPVNSDGSIYAMNVMHDMSAHFRIVRNLSKWRCIIVSTTHSFQSSNYQ